MRICTILAFVVLSINAFSDEQKWREFKSKYGRSYKNILEDKLHFVTFLQNLRIIEEHNEKFKKGEVSYKLALNKFADLSQEEFKRRLNLYKSDALDTKNVVTRTFHESEIPGTVDWSVKGAVTPVKDQGDCGGCWAFGTTGTLEGQYFLKTGQLLPLSEQFLLDCPTYSSNGCRGGWVLNALRSIRETGIVSEEDYPYEAEQKQCRATGTLLKDIGIIAVKQTEDQLKAAVASVGPVAVAVDASYMSLYDGGIFDHPECSNVSTNHAVLVVGYGTTADGIDYWIVKNSWGVDWGEDGYLKMSRNKNSQCAISSAPYYPLVL